jgi:hypothetical protein
MELGGTQQMTLTSSSIADGTNLLLTCGLHTSPDISLGKHPASRSAASCHLQRKKQGSHVCN